MQPNVSSDAVAADEDTTPGLLLEDSGLIFSATQRNSNTQQVILYYWPALFLISFSILGVVGNLLVCLAIATERRLQNRTNWFLFSLALADMLVSGLVIPLAVIKEFIGNEFYINHRAKRNERAHHHLLTLGFWILGPVVCDLWIFLDICSCTSSIMHIVVISIDRYLAINDPLNARNRQQKCKILLLIILIWLIAILLSSPMIVLGAINPLNVFIDGQCLINNQFFVTYGSVVSFVIPLIIVIIMYTLTVRRLKEQIRQCQTQLAQEQLARAASLVAKPFLRRHIPTRQAAAAAAATAATVTQSSQSTPKSAAALRRLRLQRQQTSLELSEESLENSSSQNVHKPSPLPKSRHHHIRQASEQNSQIEDVSSFSRDLHRQISTKFSPHTEYACPKNPFCQLKCTCHPAIPTGTTMPSPHSEPVAASMETLSEPKSPWHCLSYLCCSTDSLGHPCCQRDTSLKSVPMSTAPLPHPSMSSLNRSTFSPRRGRTWSRLTLSSTPNSTRTKSSAVRNEQKAVKVLGVVFVIFVVAWFPFCIMNLLQGVCKRCSINANIVNGFVWLGYVSSTINPVVYTIFNRNFRLKFIALLKCDCSRISQRHRHFAHYRNQSSLLSSRFPTKNGPMSSESRRLDTFREEKDVHLIETRLPE